MVLDSRCASAPSRAGHTKRKRLGHPPWQEHEPRYRVCIYVSCFAAIPLGRTSVRLPRSRRSEVRRATTLARTRTRVLAAQRKLLVLRTNRPRPATESPAMASPAAALPGLAAREWGMRGA